MCVVKMCAHRQNITFYMNKAAFTKGNEKYIYWTRLDSVLSHYRDWGCLNGCFLMVIREKELYQEFWFIKEKCWSDYGKYKTEQLCFPCLNHFFLHYWFVIKSVSEAFFQYISHSPREVFCFCHSYIITYSRIKNSFYSTITFKIQINVSYVLFNLLNSKLKKNNSKLYPHFIF